MVSSKHIFIVAAEPSADALGAEVAANLKDLQADLKISAIGGEALNAAGLPSKMDIEGLAVLGFMEGLQAYGHVKRKVAEAVDIIAKEAPDAVILIDSWGFMLRVALELKEKAPQIKRIKLIGPQVWATRAGRAKTLSEAVDALICMHDFEQPFYEPYNLPTMVCGNPALARAEKGDGEAFKVRHKLKSEAPIVLIAPGSRQSEMKRVAPKLFEAGAKLVKEIPDLQIVIPALASFREEIESQIRGHDFSPLIVGSEERFDAFAAADLALACSGTVTTEIAIQQTPMIVGYKIGWITWAIARGFLFKSKYVTLLNVAADEEIVEELLQTKFTSANLIRSAKALLDNSEARKAQIKAQNEALKSMGFGGTPAAEISAKYVLSQLS